MENIKKLFGQNGIKIVSACRFSSLEDRLIQCRAKSRIPDNAKTVLVCLFPYLLPKYDNRNISRYACVRDYHEIAGQTLNKICSKLKELYPLHSFEPFADNSPIPEVYAAALSGLGIIGKNGLLINKTYGSWVFIGEIVTDLELEIKEAEIKYCPDCGMCQSHCPGGALSGQFDKTNCLSFLTQKKGGLSIEEKNKIKENGLVWGCDGCQEICPYNKDVVIAPFEGFLDGISQKYRPGDDISGRAFEWRGKNVMLRNYDIVNNECDRKEDRNGLSNSQNR